MAKVQLGKPDDDGGLLFMVSILMIRYMLQNLPIVDTFKNFRKA